MELFAVGVLKLGLDQFYTMSYREYMSRVRGHMLLRKERRSELRAIAYPIYYLMHKKGFTGQPMKPEDYLPVETEGKEPEQIVDRNGYMKEAFEKANPHLKGKKYKKPVRRKH